MVLMWCWLARHANKLTQAHISCLSRSLPSSSLLYLEVGLAVMAEVWEWGLPASGSLVLSPLAEEREISPVHKHTGITYNQGLMDAWIHCWVMLPQHIYLCLNQGFLPPCLRIFKITCSEITSTESWATLSLSNTETDGGKISQQI